MPESIEVDVKALKAMVQKLIELEVYHRCHAGAALVIQDPLVQAKLAYDFEQAKGRAGDAVLLQYRDLMEALNTGNDIRSALSKFVGQRGWAKVAPRS